MLDRNSSQEKLTVPGKKMRNDKSNLKGIMRLKGFTLLELLIVMSIIVVLMGILLPCLIRAKESAYELFAVKTEVDEEGKVRLEIQDPSDRKPQEGIYMIKIERPGRCRVVLKKPHPSGMKLIKRDGQDYIKWRPEWAHIGVHSITVVFEGQEPAEQEIRVYVFNKELLEAQRKEKSDAD